MIELNVVLFASATAIGHYGGFPRPPYLLQYAVDHFSFLRWALLFVLIWQGGASKSKTSIEQFATALLIVASFFFLRMLLDTIFHPDKRIQ
jgi:hypothetical protein